MTAHGLELDDLRLRRGAADPANFPDTANAADRTSASSPTSRPTAAAGTLPQYSFLEPSWGSTGNSQHPNYDVALGEQLIQDVY